MARQRKAPKRSLEEDVAEITGTLSELSKHTRERLSSIEGRLNHLDQRLDAKAGTWEVRVLTGIVVAVLILFKYAL